MLGDNLQNLRVLPKGIDKMRVGVNENLWEDMADYRFRKLPPVGETRSVVWRSHKHDAICRIQNRTEVLIMSDMAVARINKCLKIDLVDVIF